MAVTEPDQIPTPSPAELGQVTGFFTAFCRDLRFPFFRNDEQTIV
jgi:hypothetical protein